MVIGQHEVQASPEQIAHAMVLLWSSMGVGNHQGDAYDIGSCFLLTPKVLVTADHCIEDVVELLRREGVRHPEGEYKTAFRAAEPPDWTAIGIREVVRIPDIDAAFLLVDDSEPREKPLPDRPVIRLTRPALGEQLLCAGFTEVETRFNEEESSSRGRPVIGLRAKAIVASGIVGPPDDEPEGLRRDLVRLDGVEVPHGMSGGPVYDAHGRCVGLTSGAFKDAFSRVATWDQILKITNSPPEPGPIELDLGFGELILHVDNRVEPT